MGYPYALKDVVQVSLFINDIEFPFTKQSTLGFVHLSESSKLSIPMLRVQVIDNIGFVRKNPNALVEGALVRVEIIARGIDSFTREFRINSLTLGQDNLGYVIDFDAYLNFPKFWIETTDKIYVKESSSNVLADVSRYCGFTFEGVDTADHQNWYGSLDRLHTFCEKVSVRGFASESSCMKLAVTLSGKLLYKDVAALSANAKAKATFSIGEIAKGKIPVVSHLPKNMGGATNRRSGYRQTYLEYSTTRQSVHRVHNNMIVTVDDGGTVNINQEVRGAVTTGAQKFGAIDYGNAADSYERAAYQNARGTGMFNVGLDIVTPVPTVTKPGLEIFDTVLVEAPERASEQSSSYIIVSRAIMVTPSHYVEKFELTRRSSTALAEKSNSREDKKSFEPATSELYMDEN
jgi:hypothetical protein